MLSKKKLSQKNVQNEREKIRQKITFTKKYV